MQHELKKTEVAVSLLRGGKLKEALVIFHTFRLGFTKSEKRTLDIASETLSGNGRFYQQLGIDTQLEVEKAKALLEERYLKR